MKTPEPPAKVLSFAPNPARLLRDIRLIAAKSENVHFSKHALERMEERDVTDKEAIQVLCIGEIKGPIEAGSAAGEWKCKLAAKIRGSRSIGVITIVMEKGILLVKTVEWEDL